MTPPVPIEKQMRLRYAGVCRVCGIDLPAGVEALYERDTRTVRCLGCETDGYGHRNPSITSLSGSAAAEVRQPQMPEQIEHGVAGASARRQHERRSAKDEQRVRTRHPRLGGLILALSPERQSTRAWLDGAIGEERLGARLDQLVSNGVQVLHDRRIPGTRANIDHILIAAGKVWVVDAKRYKGRPTLEVRGGLFRSREERLLVGRRNCTALVDGVLRQVQLVRQALLTDGLPAEVTGALAFVDADWPLIGGSFTTRGVHVLWPKRLVSMLSEPGHDDDVAIVAGALARRFPPA